MPASLSVVEPPERPYLPPPLKWAGGKRWLVPRLRHFTDAFPQHRLVEPFCGGLAVSLGLGPRRALLGDVNPYVVNFYHWLQRGLKIKIPMRNDAACYYEQRDWFNHLAREGDTTSRESAELFYYLNRTGFNGLCRFNQSGEFNVPFGRYKSIPYRRDLTAYREVLAGWEFVAGDFEGVERRPGDLIYADPPYAGVFGAYAQRRFLDVDQLRLAQWLAAHDGPVLASNADADGIDELYRSLGFAVVHVSGPRRISCTGDREPAREILAYRNPERGCVIPEAVLIAMIEGDC